jgi:hypothetical protein
VHISQACLGWPAYHVLWPAGPPAAQLITISNRQHSLHGTEVQQNRTALLPTSSYSALKANDLQTSPACSVTWCPCSCCPSSSTDVSA